MTGLDSSTSYSLVEKLQHLAAMGRTIVTTIHQPRFVLCFFCCGEFSEFIAYLRA
jgi:ABC-type multidrug transport system ATPase subunit